MSDFVNAGLDSAATTATTTVASAASGNAMNLVIPVAAGFLIGASTVWIHHRFKHFKASLPSKPRKLIKEGIADYKDKGDVSGLMKAVKWLEGEHFFRNKVKQDVRTFCSYVVALDNHKSGKYVLAREHAEAIGEALKNICDQIKEDKNWFVEA